MRRTSILIVLLALSTAFLLTSCDESPAITMELGDVSLELPIELELPDMAEEGSGVMKMRTYTNDEQQLAFSGEIEELSLEHEMFNQIKEDIQAGNVTKLILNAVKLQILPKANLEYTISDIQCTTIGLAEELVLQIENIEIDTDYSSPELTEYIESILNTIQEGETIGLKMSGVINNINQIDGEYDLTDGEIGVVKFLLNMAAKISIDTNATDLAL